MLRLTALFPALLLLPSLGFAETHAPGIVLQPPQVALPQLKDALGWKQPMYHSTIQTADIDGDGQSEVLARWIDGLNIYRFENGTLVRHSRISALSDNAGFYEPSWYSTIHTAVLDGKLGQADIIAREHDGMHVFRYDRDKHEWREVGSSASVRPFADTDADGTDWTQPKHYLTIQAGDLTGDGVAELVGRGHNGMQVWQWDAAGENWTSLSSGGALTDDEGFDQEPYYHSIQLVDVDHDGVPELVARAPTGIETRRWVSGGWTRIDAKGPFGDDDGFLTGKRYKSVRTFVDSSGRAWLFGLAVGSAGAGSGAIQVHRWKRDHWQWVRTIPLPDAGWDRESQFATLRAADLQGDAEPEFLVRGPRGLHAYTVEGRRLPMHSKSFTDAQGWNLSEQHSTLQTVTARLTEKKGSTLRTLVLGRGSKGLEVYKFAGQWTAAAESNFPQYCANGNDTSANCVAYKTISGLLIEGQVDIRSQYTQAGYNKASWKDFQSRLNDMSNPIGPANSANWQTVKSEMVQELGYVATVRGWFDNNYLVLNDNYNRSADLLGQAQNDVSLAAQTSVTSKWLEFAANIVSGIAGFFDGGPAISLLITILEDSYNAAASSGGDITEQVAQIYTDLNNQKSNLNSTNATQQTAYLTDYSKLQQIGRNTTSGGFDWANATLDDIGKAQNGAAQGMLINFYKTLLPYKWQVYWCTGQHATCHSEYTQDKYDCQYESPNSGWYDREAYIYAGATQDVNWGLADKLTGTGKDDVNAIWYMMLLGGDLGWDLPQWGSIDNGPYVNYPDPLLAYDKIKYRYVGESTTGCDGNGSFNGVLSANQTLSERLSVAQHNTRHVTGTEANGILKDFRTLKQNAKAASLDQDTEIELTSPLREAAKLIERALPSQQGSVSATTPTHLMELFIRRAQLHTPELGDSQVKHLTTQAYCLVAELEGQDQPDGSCRN